MPKIKAKSNRAAAKRFRRTGKGKFSHKSSFRRHLLTHKARKRKRKLRGSSLVNSSDHARVRKLLKH